ncbi:unnamed protein product [Cuscuta europaea]|uniref:Uncharacterized protein n=1 Tax=Cuscuta europaea TaxID=41803 RepID=A0A9P0YKC4_CUSEU|nr:unnamed protein product [Cuscuta europaea]
MSLPLSCSATCISRHQTHYRHSYATRLQMLATQQSLTLGHLRFTGRLSWQEFGLLASPVSPISSMLQIVIGFHKASPASQTIILIFERLIRVYFKGKENIFYTIHV